MFRLISYRKEIGLAGLLYFSPISNTDSEMSGLSMKLNYLKRLCQSELNRVILATNESELKRHCKLLIDQGLSVKRFQNEPSSTFDILHPIVQAALSRQNTIGRALLVGRSLATTAIKSLQLGSPPIIVYERSNPSSFTDTYIGSRIIGPYGCGKSQV